MKKTLVSLLLSAGLFFTNARADSPEFRYDENGVKIGDGTAYSPEGQEEQSQIDEETLRIWQIEDDFSERLKQYKLKLSEDIDINEKHEGLEDYTIKLELPNTNLRSFDAEIKYNFDVQSFGLSPFYTFSDNSKKDVPKHIEFGIRTYDHTIIDCGIEKLASDSEKVEEGLN